MKILVVNNAAPFVWGGAEELATSLASNLSKSGQQVELMRLPFQWEPAERIPQQMLLVRALELWNVDRVIALKFPAYLVRHPHKTLWLVHQFRQAYDLYDAGESSLLGRAGADALRHVIKAADDECLGECEKIYTISPVVSERLKRYHGVASESMIVPLNDPELFTGGRSEGYVFAGGRINSGKRQHLLVAAMAHAPKSARLVVAGPPDTPEDAKRLERLVEEQQLGDRVLLDLRFLSRAELASYVNGAAVCAYLPFQEDSLGYVTMEAAQAGKAVITTQDSGGVLGLVAHGQSGWVCEPTVRSLADAVSQAVSRPRQAEQMGQAARYAWARLDVTWPRIIERLLA